MMDAADSMRQLVWHTSHMFLILQYIATLFAGIKGSCMGHETLCCHVHHGKAWQSIVWHSTVQHHDVLHSMAQHSMASLPKQASLASFSASFAVAVSAHYQVSLHCSPRLCSICMVWVSRCEAAGANVKDGSAPKPSEFNLSETWQASSNLQQLCAEGLGCSTSDLIKSRQSQGLLAGRLM